jgi:hypothetical protein
LKNEQLKRKNVSLGLTISLLAYVLYFFYIVVIQIRYKNPNISTENKKRKSFFKRFFEHFSNMRDILDFMVVTLGITALVSNLFNIKIEENMNERAIDALKIMNALFFFVSWIRVLVFARGLRITSALIRLLNRVFRDMIGFLIVLFFILIGVALTCKL